MQNVDVAERIAAVMLIRAASVVEIDAFMVLVLGNAILSFKRVKQNAQFGL
jgi:hypothetical protein